MYFLTNADLKIKSDFHTFSILSAKQVVGYAKQRIRHDNKLMKSLMKQYHMSVPSAFKGVKICDPKAVDAWVKKHPVVLKAVHQDRSIKGCEKQIKMVNEYCVARQFLVDKKHLIDDLSVAKKNPKAEAVFPDVVTSAPLFRLWDVSPKLIAAWRNAKLQTNKYYRYFDHLSDDEGSAYLSYLSLQWNDPIISGTVTNTNPDNFGMTCSALKQIMKSVKKNDVIKGWIAAKTIIQNWNDTHMWPVIKFARKGFLTRARNSTMKKHGGNYTLGSEYGMMLVVNKSNKQQYVHYDIGKFKTDLKQTLKSVNAYRNDPAQKKNRKPKYKKPVDQGLIYVRREADPDKLSAKNPNCFLNMDALFVGIYNHVNKKHLKNFKKIAAHTVADWNHTMPSIMQIALPVGFQGMMDHTGQKYDYHQFRSDVKQIWKQVLYICNHRDKLRKEYKMPKPKRPVRVSQTSLF